MSLETRLRGRIDELVDSRDWYRSRFRSPSAGERVHTCVYCGKLTFLRGVPAACPIHVGLVPLDPHYQVAA